MVFGHIRDAEVIGSDALTTPGEPTGAIGDEVGEGHEYQPAPCDGGNNVLDRSARGFDRKPLIGLLAVNDVSVTLGNSAERMVVRSAENASNAARISRKARIPRLTTLRLNRH